MEQKLLVLMVALLAILASGCGGGDPSSEDVVPNTSPTSYAGLDQAVDENTLVSLSGSGTDSDGTIVRHSWIQIRGTMVTLLDGDTASAYFTAPDVDSDEDLVFQFTVTDDDGASDMDTVTITVSDVVSVSLVTVDAKVVDEQDVGLGGLNLVFTDGTVEATTTDLDGNFTVTLSVGQHSLTISQGAIELFNQLITVQEDGTFQDFGTEIAVSLPVDREPLKDDIVADLPPLKVEPPTPVSGEEVTVSLSVPDASQLDLIVSGEGCGDLIDQHVSGETLTQSATVGSAGECMLEARVTTASDAFMLILATDFTVTPTDITLPTVSVKDGDYNPGGILPDPSPSIDRPVVLDIESPGSLINGSVGTLQITAMDIQGLEDIVRVQVAVDGVPGFFTIPVLVQNEKITLDVLVDRDFFNAPALSDTQIPSTPVVTSDSSCPIGFTFVLVDRNGHYSDPFTHCTDVTEVGAGTLQISLSWNTATDVDLHVVEPSGETIYYSNTRSASGGELDLDSNPACDIDGINNENITWSSDVPPTGEYTVLVDYYEACEGKSANFTVTVNNCGQIGTFYGSFGPADDGDPAREITRFNFSCSARVAGRATYEDFAQTSSGLSSRSTMLPIRHAKIQVRRASDDTVLEEDSTGGDGHFDIEFTNDGTPGYYVIVLAEQDNAYVNQQVVDRNGMIYGRKSEVINEMTEPEKTNLVIEARRMTAGPAFNIFDMGVVGAAVVRARHGEVPPMLTWLWTSGQQGACSGLVSCYQDSRKRISVLSVSSDPDEYDDLVLLHEYGHFYQHQYSKSHSPGGSHSSRNQVDPRLAWGEGSATFFGNFSKGTSLYLDTISSGIGVRLDLESLSSLVPLGTSNGRLEGRISEAVVAAVMWDLYDNTQEAPNGNAGPMDTVRNADSVFSAMRYVRRVGAFAISDLLSSRNHRGVDLVDFLDGWFCEGNGNRGNTNTGVEGIANGLHQFPYDFANNVCRE